MSNHAYRVIEIKHADEESFSSWDQDLYDRLSIYGSLDSDGCGLVTIDLEELEQAVAEAEAGELKLSPETITRFKADIQTAKESENTWVEYYIT